MKLSKLYTAFFKSEKTGGLLLIFCTLISLTLANSSFGETYRHFWQMEIANQSIDQWINDGLMTVFFLLIGLELKREIYQGELSKFKDAMLPIFAAIGGILVPAGIFLLFNFGTPTQAGAGIPMATDIAFALGVLSLLGNKVPASLKIFLTALAVIDDLGAILVIAVFYSQTIFWINLFVALAIFAGLILLNRLRVNRLTPYVIGGIAMWYFMLHSGVHATITGVLLAFAIPFGKGEKVSPSYKAEYFLHKPVAFIILPVFALANTAIILTGDFNALIFESYSLGIALGLIIGKPTGIFIFTLVGYKLGVCKIPKEMKWKHIIHVGFLGGIGFTMSIFITLLAFDDGVIINNAKLIILLASLIAGAIGFFALKTSLKTGLNPIETD